jgi:hypothetical protein
MAHKSERENIPNCNCNIYKFSDTDPLGIQAKKVKKDGDCYDLDREIKITI